MKKILAILSIMAASITAQAAEVELEYGHEAGRYAPTNTGPRINSNYFVMTPTWELGKYELGLKFEQARTATADASLENKLELQIQRKVLELGKFKTAVQLGLGRDFNQNSPSATPDFDYYQVSIKPKYKLNDQLVLETSYRYRNAFGHGHYFESNTVKAGVAYKLSDKMEIGLRYGVKFSGDEHAHLVEGGLTLGF
jgi:opacity protein-like surface antigen